MASTRSAKNWSEFINALNISSAGDTINITADLYPDALTTVPIELKASTINGNGHGIYNIRVDASVTSYTAVFNTVSGTNCTFNNLNFINFYISKYLFNTVSANLTLNGCKLNGVLGTGLHYRMTATCIFEKCALAIRSNTDSACISTSPNDCTFSNSNVHLYGTWYSTVPKMINSKLWGDGTIKLPNNGGLNYTKTNSVFDINITYTSSGVAINYNTACIFNKDKQFITTGVAGLTGVTTAQMTDVPYLQSIGFEVV